MQGQLALGPHVALQVAELATQDQIRRAFLSLTKQFHPARFARMAPEVQKLSNEVFLGIKAAHETMLRALGASIRPGGGMKSSSSSGAIPAAVAAEGTGGPANARTTAKMPVLRPPGTARPASPSPARPRPTPPQGVPITRPGTPPNDIAVPRTLTPGSTRPLTPVGPPHRPSPSPGIRPLTPPGRPTTPNVAPAAPPAQRTAPVHDDRVALQQALELIAIRDWRAAGTALSALASRVPHVKSYQALLYYVRGRSALDAGKLDDATLEFKRALELDPEMPQARMALADLRRR